MKGYKVFNPDWTCRGFQYEVGKTYEMSDDPVCCERGFHFCLKPVDCFYFYSFDPNNKVAEVEALGVVDTQDENSKCSTNKIHIIRELTWHEVLDLVNTGKDCTGFCNTGNRNSGDWNTGSCNTGNWNTGNWNTGDWNSGRFNSGIGNSGDWNKTSFSSGCFNTEEEKILMFNKPSDWTLRDWWESEASSLLNGTQKYALKWVCSEDMTDQEKEDHPEYKATGGYLKELDESERGQIWWNNLTDVEKETIKSLPNFDPEIFKQVTGVDVSEGEEE